MLEVILALIIGFGLGALAGAAGWYRWGATLYQFEQRVRTAVQHFEQKP